LSPTLLNGTPRWATTRLAASRTAVGVRVWCGIETEGAEQPRHVYLAIVHFAPLGSPLHTAA
jgi:hypothetical protein